jgi:hypothetical protein
LCSEARDVLDVYSAADLVSAEEMSALRGDAETYLASFGGDRAAVEAAVDAKHVSPYLGSLLKKFVGRAASPATLDSLGLALYAEAASLLVRASPKALQSKGAALLLPHLLPAALRVKIFEGFTEAK